jgi:hypothetical protein
MTEKKMDIYEKFEYLESKGWKYFEKNPFQITTSEVLGLVLRMPEPYKRTETGTYWGYYGGKIFEDSINAAYEVQKVLEAGGKVEYEEF